MSSTRFLLVPAALFCVGCSGEPEPFVRTAQGAAEPSQIQFQAVDAGTGEVLADDELTVRYLVRAPITLDASAVEEAPADEPYTVRHEVAGDSLVLEVRLEAESYHRLDTVLAVSRGGQGGPYTLRMARRLERTADAAPSRPAPARTQPRPEETAPSGRPAATPSATPDRAPLEAGNAAFGADRWNAAIQSYAAMAEPADRGGDYARDYQEALVRKGISHMNVGEYGGALEALEEAVTFDFPNGGAYLHLGRAQCAVGRVDEGKGTLSALSRVAQRMPVAAREELLVLGSYHTGICSHLEVEQAEGTVALVRAGGQAVRDLEAFIQEAEALSDPSPTVAEALADARTRIEEIRQRVRRGG